MNHAQLSTGALPPDMEGKRVFLSLSGGLDSATLHAFLLMMRMDVRPVFFRYPSRHNSMEYGAARRIAAFYASGPLLEIDAVGLFRGARSNLLLGGGDLPRGEYDDENIKLTVIPGRNTIFIAALAGLAQSLSEGGKTYVALGVHGGDHAVYPDCRPEYIESVRKTILLSSEGAVEVIAPFVLADKAQIVRFGLSHFVPYELTRSCYAGADSPCRVCPACRAREAAFAANGVTDPIPA
ncbi:MAG: 7-cyano-7-deazaguanine synthase [Desulfovibrio sp.]|jgi:7-cyano-7-deazaguanine synthase|nr:7-cyano-7-deazaguanine synthase [Desulfovibrio sp.]